MKMNGEENVMHSRPHRRSNRSKSVPSMCSNSVSEDNTELQPLRLRSGTDSGQRLVPSLRSKSRLSSGGLLRSQSKKRRSVNGLEKSRSIELHDERDNSSAATSGESIQSGDETQVESDVFRRRKQGVFSVDHLLERRDINMDVQGDFHGDRQGEQTVFIEGVCETESGDVGEQQPSSDDTELEFSRQNTDSLELQTSEQNEQDIQNRENITDSESAEEQLYNNAKTQEGFSQLRRRSLPVKLSQHDTGLNINYQKGHERFKHISTENYTTCEDQELRKYNSMPSHLNKDNFDADCVRNESNNTADKLKHRSTDIQTDTLKQDHNFYSHENVSQNDQFRTSEEHLADDSQNIQCIPQENTATSENGQVDQTYSLSSAQKVITHDKRLEKLAVTSHSVTEGDKPVNSSLTKYKRAKPKRQRRTKSLPALLDLKEVPEDKEEDSNIDRSLENVAKQHVNKAFYELLKRISRNQAKKTRKQVRRTHSLSTIQERQLEENEQLNEASFNGKLMEEKCDNNDNANETTSSNLRLNTQLDNNIMDVHPTVENDRREIRTNEHQCTNVENVNHNVEDYGNNQEHLSKTGETRESTHEEHETSDNENKHTRDVQREERGEFSQKEVDKEKSEQNGLQSNEKKKKKKKRKKKKKGKGTQAQPEACVEEEQPVGDGIQGDHNDIQADIEGTNPEVDGNEGELNGNEGDDDRFQGEIEYIGRRNSDVIQGELDCIQGNLNGIQGNCDGIQGNCDGIQGNRDGIQGNRDGIQGNRNDIQEDQNGIQGLASSPEEDSNLPESCPESDRMQHESCLDEYGAETESFPEADRPQVELALEDDELQPNLYPDDEETQSELRPEDEQSLNELCSEELESYPEDDRQQSEPTTEVDRQQHELIPEDDQQQNESGGEDDQQEPESHPTGDREESKFLPEDERAHYEPYLQEAQVSEHVFDQEIHSEYNTNITEQSTDEYCFVISIEAQEETATVDYHPEHEQQQEPDSHDNDDIEIPQISVSQVVVEKSRSIQVDHHEKPVSIDEIEDPEHFHSDILEHVQSVDYTLLDTSVPQRPKVLPTMESIDEDSCDVTDDHDSHYTFKRTGSIRRKAIRGNMSLPLENTTAQAPKRVTWSEDLIEAKSPDTPMSFASDFAEGIEEEINEAIDEEDLDDDGNIDVVDGDETVDQYDKELQDFDEIVRNVINAYLEPDYKESKSSVHRAVARGCVDTLTELIDDGVDVNANDEHGWPPLHVAMLTNNIECAEILLDAGADLQQYTDSLVKEYYTVTNEVLMCS